MTPQEKAEELIGKMMLHCYSQYLDDEGRSTARLCAIICAKQSSSIADAFAPLEVQEFWEKVIYELEKP